MYKLTNRDIVIHLSDGAGIPADPTNTDYAAYLEWLADGNTPEPADPPTPEQIALEMELALERYTDQVAQSGPRRYRSAESCVGYVGDADPAVDVEARAYKLWRSAFWAEADVMKADVLAGLRPIPTLEEVIAELPQMAWPT